ncbi:MAG TPA: Ig-like domain-containing protein [Patescibacteria group bacterium]|nr:Ig-like domain-containing protein [Patescibacteria group bacterium]
MCIPGRENEGGCVAFSATVPCNTAGVCRTTIKFTSCTYDTGSGACAVNPVEYMGCCGPGSGTPTGTAPPTPTPSCTVDLLPATAPTSVGSAVTLTASVTIGSGTVDSVNFVSTDTGIATVNPASDSTAVYSTQATGVANGTTTVTANVIMGGASRCSDTASVEVLAAGPWWQVRDADVTSGGDVVSPIPATCSLPVCDPVLNLQGTGGFPGIALYSGLTADFQAGSGTGTVAEAPYGWLVNSSYSSSKIYDLSYFLRQIPPDVTFTEIDSPTYNGGDFNSGGSPARGYVWYHYNGATLGDMTISGNVNLTGSRKVVLLVEGADLYITGRINIQSYGSGYFMVVVGKDANGLKGNIIVDPSVSHPTQPSIEGVYLAEGEFRTGAGTNQLRVRGAVAAYDGIVLERDLEAENADTPAEYFEYAPDIIATFPQVFTSRRMRWKEVAP